MIGNPEHMEDPTGHVTQRVAGTVTAAMLIQEALRRRRAQRIEAEAAASRLRAEGANVADAGKPTEMPTPDRDAVLKAWQTANSRGEPGGDVKQEAERILSHTEPELLRGYTALQRDGQHDGDAMAQALRETKPNPTPPAEIPNVDSAGDSLGDTPLADRLRIQPEPKPTPTEDLEQERQPEPDETQDPEPDQEPPAPPRTTGDDRNPAAWSDEPAPPDQTPRPLTPAREDELHNPLVVETTGQWQQIADDAGWPRVVDPRNGGHATYDPRTKNVRLKVGWENTTRAEQQAMTQQLADHVRRSGHDGIVFRPPRTAETTSGASYHWVDQVYGGTALRLTEPGRGGPQPTPHARTRDGLLRSWHAGNAAGKPGGQAMRNVERILGHTEPELISRYIELTRDGRPASEAMATAARDTSPNPNPPSTVPETNPWSGGFGSSATAGGGQSNAAIHGWHALKSLNRRKKGASVA